MAEVLDSVSRYAKTLGFDIRPRTIIVEGTTDVDLFKLAAYLERATTGIDLFGTDITIVAAGERDRGGTNGVIRQLIALREIARTCLLPNGRPCYRFIGLFDNDLAGKKAVSLAHSIDNSILEYKDVFRLWPVMPRGGSLDPKTLQRTFESQNAYYKRLEWELEDLLTQDFVEAFLSEYPNAVLRNTSLGGRVHRDLTPDGKAQFHRFIKLNALRGDVAEVIEVLKSLRYYLGLPYF